MYTPEVAPSLITESESKLIEEAGMTSFGTVAQFLKEAVSKMGENIRFTAMATWEKYVKLYHYVNLY